jgi:hypothetical protein
MALLEAPGADVVVRPWTAAQAAVGAFYEPARAAGIDERYLLRIDGHEFPLSSVDGGGEARARPDLVLEANATTWIDIRQRRTTMREAIRAGRLVTHGRKAALAHFGKIFQLV